MSASDDRGHISRRYFLSIAHNWGLKKNLLVAGRLPHWKAGRGTEDEPEWYMLALDTIPARRKPLVPLYRFL